MIVQDMGRELMDRLIDKAQSVISFGPDRYANEDMLRSSCACLFENMRRHVVFVKMQNGPTHWAITNIDQLVGLLNPSVRVGCIVKMRISEVDKLIPSIG